MPRSFTSKKLIILFLAVIIPVFILSLFLIYQNNASKAIKTSYKSLSEIVEYIVLVLEREPQKASLHFDAGLVYKEMGDYMLMKQHFAHYLSEAKRLDPRILGLLRGKMQAVSCGKKCDYDCILCSA